MRARWAVLAALALVAGASGLWAGGGGRDDFPHELHARLFPRCTGCHAAAGGFGEALFPGKQACATCHDGRDLGAVAWTGPHIRPSNLHFSHVDHASRLRAEGRSADCATCHSADGATTVRATMRDLTGPRPEYCIRCHAHEAPVHLAESAQCRTCHVPLARATGLDSAAIAGLPRAPGHEAPDFALAHGAGVGAAQAQARCAICHTRDSCERCHLNGAAIPAIAALDSDPRVARLLASRPARYPRPVSHRAGWAETHAAAARAGVAQCANCHTRDACRTCHIGAGGQARIDSLPAARGGSARPATSTGGVAPGSGAAPPGPRASGPRVHPAGFADRHGTAAASGSAACRGCHADSYCSTCHAGASRPVFHPANYMARHGADAYGGAKDCASCHSTESFCKTCHQGAGLAAHGRVDVAFHDGQPLWLLQHGEAARKGLEGCVSCHRQQDCTRCHSASGGWGVNPHGSGFDAGTMSERNQLMCARCHVTVPGSKP